MHAVEFESLLVEALAPLRPTRVNGACGPWVLRPGRGDDSAGITLLGPWVSLHAHGRPKLEGPSLEALSAHGTWPGGAKWVQAAPGPLVRADVPLLANGLAGRNWLGRQLRASICGTLAVADLPRLDGQPVQPTAAIPDPELLAYACHTGGWNPMVKPDGSVHLDVQVRGMPRTVVLQQCSHSVRVSVTIAAITEGTPAACDAATALFLTRASAAMRWARAFAEREAGHVVGVGFECEIAAPHDERPPLLAIDTLITACELFGHEVELLLEEPEIASCYLRLQGTPALDADDQAPPDRAVAPAPAASHPAALAA